MRIALPAIAALVTAAAACTGTSRGLEAYRDDTTTLLNTRRGELATCYNDALKTDAQAHGTVTVQFVVEKSSGTIGHATVDAARSSAPPALGQCVVHAVDGLVLAPPDRNEGRATFTYEFKANPAPTS